MKTLAGCFIASLLLATGTARATLINGGFETGDLTGWQKAGDASIQTASFGSGPSQGTYQAVLTDNAGNAPGPISGTQAVGFIDSLFLGLPPGSLAALTVDPELSPLNPGPSIVDGASAISQTFDGVAGSQLSFQHNFVTNDGYNFDMTFVSLVSPNFHLFEKLAGNDPSTLQGGPNPLVASNTVFERETGFKTFSFILPATATYTLAIGVAQVFDSSIDSGIIIDAVKVAFVPECSSLLFFGAGLVGLAAWRWKHAA